MDNVFGDPEYETVAVFPVTPVTMGEMTAASLRVVPPIAVEL
jgi:hypothetical protein